MGAEMRQTWLPWVGLGRIERVVLACLRGCVRMCVFVGGKGGMHPHLLGSPHTRQSMTRPQSWKIPASCASVTCWSMSQM